MRKVRIWLSTTSAALMLAVAAPSGADVSPATRVTGDDPATRSHIAPSLAVDPRDADHLVAVAVLRTEPNAAFGTCMAYASMDGARTWSSTALPVPAGAACRTNPFPKVAFAKGGAVVAAYFVAPADVATVPTPLTTFRVASPGKILLARSTDGGTTFAQPVEVSRTLSEETGSLPLRSLALATDDSGNHDLVYVARSVGTPRWVWVSRSGDGGRSFEGPTVVPMPRMEGFVTRGTSLGPPALAAEGGRVMVAATWYTGRDPLDYNVWWIRLVFARSDDAGRTFGETTLVGPMLAHYDFGRGFYPVPALAVDPSNAQRAYLAYEDERDGSVTKSIHLVRSTDGGATWRAGGRLSDAREEAGFPHERVALSVAPNGRLDAAWYDGRNDPTSVTPRCPQPDLCGGRDVIYTYSLDHGITFARNVSTTPATFAGYRRRLGTGQLEAFGSIGLASSNDRAAVVWEQSAGADPDASQLWDLYAATIDRR